MTYPSVREDPECSTYRNTEWGSSLAQARRARADELVAQGKNEEALKIYDQLICIFPWEIGTWVAKAGALANLGRTGAAEDCYVRGIREYHLWQGESRPPVRYLAATYYYYAIFLIGEKRPPEYDNALLIINKAIEIYDQECEFFALRAALHSELGHEQSLVEADYARTLELTSVSGTAEASRLLSVKMQTLRNRAYYYVSVGDLAKALLDAESLIAIDPANVEAHFIKGKVLFLQGNQAGAFESLSVARELGCQNQELSSLLEKARPRPETSSK